MQRDDLYTEIDTKTLERRLHNLQLVGKLRKFVELCDKKITIKDLRKASEKKDLEQKLNTIKSFDEIELSDLIIFNDDQDSLSSIKIDDETVNEIFKIFLGYFDSLLKSPEQTFKFLVFLTLIEKIPKKIIDQLFLNIIASFETRGSYKTIHFMMLHLGLNQTFAHQKFFPLINNPDYFKQAFPDIQTFKQFYFDFMYQHADSNIKAIFSQIFKPENFYRLFKDQDSFEFLIYFTCQKPELLTDYQKKEISPLFKVKLFDSRQLVFNLANNTHYKKYDEECFSELNQVKIEPFQDKKLTKHQEEEIISTVNFLTEIFPEHKKFLMDPSFIYACMMKDNKISEYLWKNCRKLVASFYTDYNAGRDTRSLFDFIHVKLIRDYPEHAIAIFKMHKDLLNATYHGYRVNEHYKKPLYYPMHTAADNGHFDLVCYLITQGCHVNYENAILSPLAVAVYNKQASVVKLLLQFGAKANVEFMGQSLVDYCLSSKDNFGHEIIPSLLAYGAKETFNTGHYKYKFYYQYHALKEVLVHMKSTINMVHFTGSFLYSYIESSFFNKDYGLKEWIWENPQLNFNQIKSRIFSLSKEYPNDESFGNFAAFVCSDEFICFWKPDYISETITKENLISIADDDSKGIINNFINNCQLKNFGIYWHLKKHDLLIEAIKKGKESLVYLLLKIDPDLPAKKGALSLAVELYNKKIIQILLDHGVNPELEDVAPEIYKQFMMNDDASQFVISGQTPKPKNGVIKEEQPSFFNRAISFFKTEEKAEVGTKQLNEGTPDHTKSELTSQFSFFDNVIQFITPKSDKPYNNNSEDSSDEEDKNENLKY